MHFNLIASKPIKEYDCGMPYYKATYFAGSSALMQYTLHHSVVRKQLVEWFDQQAKRQRLIRHITVDFHNGPAAEFTLKERDDGPPELLRIAARGPTAAVQD